MGNHYTFQHGIDYKVLDKMDKDIILDYVWEDMDMMDKLRQWIKDTYDSCSCMDWGLNHDRNTW